MNNQQYQEEINYLVTCVQIRAGFLRLYKLTRSEDDLVKANSWTKTIKSQKESIRLLLKHGSYENFLRSVGVEI